jgi:hypothetical protein
MKNNKVIYNINKNHKLQNAKLVANHMSYLEHKILYIMTVKVSNYYYHTLFNMSQYLKIGS